MNILSMKERILVKKVEVVAAVIQNGKKILATQRGYGEFKDGWEFPGGKIETGESREEALIREIQEELTVTIKIQEFLKTVEFDYSEFHLIMHCFLCEIAKGELRLLEHESAKWVTREELDDIEWLPADVLLVSKLKERI